MADANDRLQDALAAYLEHLEMGGLEPDVSHLTDDERRELQELIVALDLTEGIAFGSGREGRPSVAEVASSDVGKRLFEGLREVLRPSVRIEADDNALVTKIGEIAIVDRAILGTFGGRVRVWLLEADAAQAIETDAACIEDLGRVFRMFPDMVAVALVGRDLSCLIVQPEDCAPTIQVPSGSLVGRRFRRAIEPAVEVIPAFLDELIPYWDPMPAFDPDAVLRINIAEVAGDESRSSIEQQRAIGERARKGNPKKDALLTLGDKEAEALDSLTKGLFEGSIHSDEVEERIQRLVGPR